MSFIANINFVYLAVLILLFVGTYAFLSKVGANKRNKLILLGLLLFLEVITFNYINMVVRTIFSLSFLSIKIYLLLIVIANAIILYTINHRVKLIYKIYNYLLFIVLMVIFGATLSIILGNKISMFYIMDISNAINLIDISIVVFMIYLLLFLSTYIGFYVFENKESNEKIDYLVKIKDKIINSKIVKKIRVKFSKYNATNEEVHILTPEELLSYNKNDGFYIDGVECSIIFDDSNKDNIVKNYYILLDNVNARLVNGYTLEENKMFKNICMKLNVNNLRNIDINNASILNRVSVEEYNLLKRSLM